MCPGARDTRAGSKPGVYTDVEYFRSWICETMTMEENTGGGDDSLHTASSLLFIFVRFSAGFFVPRYQRGPPVVPAPRAHSPNLL